MIEKSVYKFLLIAMIFIALPSFVLAQNGYDDEVIKEKPFSKKTWEKTKRGLDYSGEMPPKEKEKSENETQKEGEEYQNENEGRRGEEQIERGESWFDNSFLEGNRTLKIVFYTIAILALIFVLWRIVKAQMQLRNPKVRQRVEHLEQAVEDIHESDLERFLREALAEGNHKLAIRVYYLMIIKGLSEKQMIKWKKDKTNNAYVREMKKTEHYERFRDITRSFEKTWYGEKEIQQADFQRLEPQFQSFVSSIK